MSRFYRQVFRLIRCGRNENVLEATSFKMYGLSKNEIKESYIPKQEDLNLKFISKNGLCLLVSNLLMYHLRVLSGWNQPWCPRLKRERGEHFRQTFGFPLSVVNYCGPVMEANSCLDSSCFSPAHRYMFTFNKNTALDLVKKKKSKKTPPVTTCSQKQARRERAAF